MSGRVRKVSQDAFVARAGELLRETKDGTRIEVSDGKGGVRMVVGHGSERLFVFDDDEPADD